MSTLFESPAIRISDHTLGKVLLLVAALTIVRDWFAVPFADICAAIGIAIFLVLAIPTAAVSRRLFVAIGFGLAVVAIVSRPDWQSIVLAALGQGAFIATFFCALATLRTPSSTSQAIMRCGEYLASQPPGKRYLALTSGGHLFALILNYGAIQLLGTLAESIAGRETNEELREIRSRRMLLAIQRGFCASLLWSPLAFAMAITTSVIPGASWSGTAVYALGNAFVFAAIGWALDTIVKPKFSGLLPARQSPRGSISDVKPLAILLLTIFTGVGLIALATDLRIATVVMAFIPLVAVIWLILESRGYARPMVVVRSRLRELAFTEIPSYRSEIVLLVMAGFIGSLGASLAVPVLRQAGFDFSSVPMVVIIVAPIWLIPLFGQLGMNPILSVALFGPILPSPEIIGISPSALVCSITAGWALAGATSPFTASTMLIGRLGHTTALRVGTSWNRTFFLVCAVAMTISSLLIANLA